MYELIPAEEKHLNEIAPLLFETGHYDYAATDNKLHLAPTEFEKIQTLKPYLAYTYVLIDKSKKGEPVAAFFIAATKARVAKVDRETPNNHRDDAEITSFFTTLSEFYVDETLETDFILFGLAVNSNYRRQGLFRILMTDLHRLATESGCNRIVFSVWGSHESALAIYKHYRAKITGVIDLTDTGFADRLFKCALSVPT
jgi:GNAT superfamily N-acetyltransferase